jgi:hypothetical protein
MAADGHDQSLPYADLVAPGTSIDLDAWECWAVATGGVVHYYAKGPCPACGAASQGHVADATAPVESLGEAAEPPALATGPVEVPVRCTCGATHGRDGATSCGRRWSIICPRGES